MSNLTNTPREPRRNIEERRFKRSLRSKQKRRLRNQFQSLQTGFQGARNNSKRPPSGHAFDPVNILVPAKLDLISEYESTVTLIREIRRAALRDRRRVNLIFDNALEINPSALLFLLSEIHRCRLVNGDRSITGTYPKDKRLERTLEETGFFKLLNVVPRSSRKARKYPVEYIEFASEIGTDGEEVRKLRAKMLGSDINMLSNPRRRLYRALTEAMINVGQHAYPGGKGTPLFVRGRWWLSGHIDKRNKKMMIMFSDLGVGIPSTLPKIHPWEVIRSVASVLPGVNPNDGQMIRAAMEIGRTQTFQSNRGRGLNDMRRFIDEVADGELLIFSRKGMFSYSPTAGEKIQNFRQSIGGTLIKWTVPLDKVTDWLGTGEGDEDSQSPQDR